MSDINLKIISAGAGSGKTFRLTQEMAAYIDKGVRISGIIATTFTKKAAAELQERVRAKLLSLGKFKEANELNNALIGTVHSLGVKLLRRFAFEAGVSPEVDIVSDDDQQVIFNNALSVVLTEKRIQNMEALSTKLGLNKKNKDYDWRREIRQMTDVARANDFDKSILEKSKQQSFATFLPFLGEKSSTTSTEILPALLRLIDETMEAIQAIGDETVGTQKVVASLREIKKEVKTHGALQWHQWAKMAKLAPTKKSQTIIIDLIEFVQKHDTFTDFHQDIQDFIDSVFDIAGDAIAEYQKYKRQRGLIDYTDMEILVKHLLDREDVQDVLRDELDLLMVDEFQDTNPIQLAIFFKLSQLAKHSVWVGDPKQSIYGFRGADPKLMKAIVEAQGGVKKENIQEHSYRSRKDIVHLTNALFDKAFPEIVTEQVVLKPQRQENAAFGHALKHWHFALDGEGRAPNKEWFEFCIADAIKQFLQEKCMIAPKDGTEPRQAQANDIAILCKSNTECANMSKALHHVGLKSAIARTGLLFTAEARLLLACLKYMLNSNDSLSVAEILVLAGKVSTGEIIEQRLTYLAALGDNYDDNSWAKENYNIKIINQLRKDAVEFSSSEMLNLLIEALDLRRVVMRWGNAAQRLDNVDAIRKLALDYEDACNRMNTAASLGGYLLWLNDLQQNDKDNQSTSEDAAAINIVTYHKSKGLEYPIVICYALESELKDSVFGLKIISEKETVDLDDLLGGRWLRFWVDPYADQSKKSAMEQRMEQSEEQQNASRAALEEEVRVLYVGVTRARDYLIFPTRKAAVTKWLNRAWHDGKEDIPSLDPDTSESQWSWNEEVLGIETQTLAYPREFMKSAIPSSDFQYFEKRKGIIQRSAQFINIDNERFLDAFQVKNIVFHPYNPAFFLDNEENTVGMNKTLRHYFLSNYEKKSTIAQAELLSQIQQRFAWQTETTAVFITAANAFSTLIEQQFSATISGKNIEISYKEAERIFKTNVDAVAKNQHTIFIIKHDFYAGEKTKNKANESATWFYFTKKAFQHQFPTMEIKCFVHFPLLGTVAEIIF